MPSITSAAVESNPNAVWKKVGMVVSCHTPSLGPGMGLHKRSGDPGTHRARIDAAAGVSWCPWRTRT